MVKVSVIIVNFNGKKFIKECIDSVVKSFKGEVIVVDNASTDGSYEYLKRIYGKKIVLVRSNKQLYFTGGSNLGAKKASAEKLIFLNSDCVVTPRWIYEMVKFVGDNKKWLVQPLLRKSYGGQAKIIDNAGTSYNILGFARGSGYNERDLGQYDRNEEIEICAGACFMIDKKFFWELGGFDERYRYQYGDVDLCLRAKKRGGKCFLCYKSVVYHSGSATFKDNVSEEELLFNIRKNRLLTVIKNFRGIERVLRTGLVGVVNVGSFLAFRLRLMRAKTFERTPELGGLTKKRYEIALEYCLNKTVLDIGCGLGQGTNFLAENGAKKVLGIDYSKRAIEYAKSRYQWDNLEFLLCDATKVDSLEREFEAITAFEVIEHLPLGTYEDFLCGVTKILKKGSVFILSTPNKHYKFDGFRPVNPYHLREFSPKEILDLCKKYFSDVLIFGSEIVNNEFNKVRKSVDSSLMHNLAVYLKRNRLVCEMLSFAPAFLKRKITGEYRLPKLLPSDFKYTKEKIFERENLLLICRS